MRHVSSVERSYFGALLGEFTRKELALYCKKVLLIQEFFYFRPLIPTTTKHWHEELAEGA